jgi:hypothetical protein
MTIHELVLKALKYGIPTALTLLALVWLWVKFASLASGSLT